MVENTRLVDLAAVNAETTRILSELKVSMDSIAKRYDEWALLFAQLIKEKETEETAMNGVNEPGIEEIVMNSANEPETEETATNDVNEPENEEVVVDAKCSKNLSSDNNDSNEAMDQTEDKINLKSCKISGSCDELPQVMVDAAECEVTLAKSVDSDVDLGPTNREETLAKEVMLSHYTQNTGGGKACVYKLGDYQTVLRSLKNCKGIECEEIPWGTYNVVERFSYSFAVGKWMPCRPEHSPDEKVDQLIVELPKPLLSSLLPFQLDGVRFGLRRGVKCLIADEMGLGKTLQAIAMATCFMKEGSILVVCPAILRYSWAEELERWFPFCLPKDIHLIFGSKDNPTRLPKRPRVVVTSYTMLRILRKSMLEQEWATLIVDESHHLRSTKQASEKDELTVVLDVAMKVKHLILLSGTPSLSRPYDIFHQINMLWPGLLGQTKYEFAKTYCSVKFVWGSQGKPFQDFSKGIRLEELNVLLKQSVMIRRLKENVLPQLPPKRRQIINLVLKGSDINLAMETLGLQSGDAFDDENQPLHVSEEDKDSHMNKELSKKLSALGIAKLPGFFEWLSIHPIISEVDEEEGREEGCGSHKMIIFYYHHKVLDGVQVILCEKEIKFVRVDCNVVGSDRQATIHSFQFSKEVKIALIGIRSGGSGLNLTAADTIVFLEMPLRPADMQQAEDRAHKLGQIKSTVSLPFHSFLPKNEQMQPGAKQYPKASEVSANTVVDLEHFGDVVSHE